MTDRISKLDDETVELIAAGEVVGGPASVVKELLENSLDAEASSIDIVIEDGGKERIVVADDGHGIPAPDAPLAFERHATSKINGRGDVSEVRTLGFRGEALPSIARVAQVEMVTKADGVGATLVRTGAGTDGTETEETGRAQGTTVEVTGLFENVPARRATLDTKRSEFRRISRVVQRYSLARPDVAFSLEHDGREVLGTTGSGDYVDSLYAVYGRKLASRAVRFASEGIEGALVRPSETRSEPRHVHVAVNGRVVEDPKVRKATVKGYGTLLPKDRYPVAVVSVDVPPKEVDVNVHPSKRKVRFENEQVVKKEVETAVRDTLKTEDLTRRAEMELDTPVDEIDSSGDSFFENADVLGQFRDLYLLCESDDDLLVVDQHAAHERVNYEKLSEEFDGGVPSVELEKPETVELTPEEKATLEDNREELERAGFDIEEFGGGLYRVRGVPAPVDRVEDTEIVHDVFDSFLEGDGIDLRDETLKNVACHPSLKAGDTLDRAEASSLLDRLGECEQPFACPHGRPTVLSLNERLLAEGFERGEVRL